MSKVAYLFPGQGSQQPGMGKTLVEQYPLAREIFAVADEILGEPLSQLCFEGPAEQLTQTVHAQPALLTHAVAVARVLESETDVTPDVCAGHSLGEWSALVVAGALDFADAVRLVRLRGEAMQSAVPPGVGTMAAVVGLTPPEVEAICAQVAGDEVLELATLNGPRQLVIAGHVGAVERGMAAAREAGARLVRKLDVSAPFHCALLEPAARVLEDALASVELRTPRVPVVTNVTAAPQSDPEVLRNGLIQQVVSPVRWRETLEQLAQDGVERGLELGPGRVLSGLTRRTTRQIAMTSIGEAADIERFQHTTTRGTP